MEDDCECRVVKAKEPTLDGIVLKELKAKLLRVMDAEEGGRAKGEGDGNGTKINSKSFLITYGWVSDWKAFFIL